MIYDGKRVGKKMLLIPIGKSYGERDTVIKNLLYFSAELSTSSYLS